MLHFPSIKLWNINIYVVIYLKSTITLIKLMYCLIVNIDS